MQQDRETGRLVTPCENIDIAVSRHHLFRLGIKDFKGLIKHRAIKCKILMG